MGMFDWVDYKMNCPKCGAEVSGFQSKDGDCTLDTIKPEEVCIFYTSCPSCKIWIQFTRKIPVFNSIEKDFDMTIG